jgi:hypothetical protein
MPRRRVGRREMGNEKGCLILHEPNHSAE